MGSPWPSCFPPTHPPLVLVVGFGGDNLVCECEINEVLYFIKKGKGMVTVEQEELHKATKYIVKYTTWTCRVHSSCCPFSCAANEAPGHTNVHTYIHTYIISCFEDPWLEAKGTPIMPSESVGDVE